MITQLIDKQDGFEIVRDKIAQILADEVAAQMTLATGAGENAALWDMAVYTERANPWEQWLNDPESQPPAPVVNVWYDQDSFDMGNGNVVSSQAATGTFNVDVYGFAVSEDNPAGGHTPGDEKAALEAHRGARLARNILMAGVYTYLDLRPLVSRRWLRGRTSFQPQIDVRTVQRCAAVRLAFDIKYLEQAPQAEGDTLELIAIDLQRASDGRVLAQLEYDKA